MGICGSICNTNQDDLDNQGHIGSAQPSPQSSFSGFSAQQVSNYQDFGSFLMRLRLQQNNYEMQGSGAYQYGDGGHGHGGGDCGGDGGGGGGGDGGGD